MKNITFLQDIDIQGLREGLASPTSRTLKRRYVKQGYIYAVSIYGVLKELDGDEAEYRRIEILMDKPLTQTTFHKIYSFFLEYKPKSKYLIWLYNSQRNALKLVGVY